MPHPFAARVLLPLLLAFACLPLRAQERAGAVFHYDGRYGISFELSSAVEKLPKVSSGAVKIEKVSAETAYTDGARVLLDTAPAVSLDELNRTTDYSVIGRALIVEGEKAFLYAEQGISTSAAALIREGLPFSIPARESYADILLGRTPEGKTFRVLAPGGREPENAWSPTLAMRYAVSGPEGAYVLSEFCLPMGLRGFSRSVKDQVTAGKKDNILIGVGMGGLLAEFIKLPLERRLEYYSAIGMEAAAPGNSDIKALWEWTLARGTAAPEGVPALFCSNADIKDKKLAALIRPYYIRELAGVRTAFVSLIPSGPVDLSRMGGAPVTIRDPFREAGLPALVRRLRTVEKARLVVAVSHLDNEDLGRLMSVPGLDIVIGPKTWEKAGARRERVELAGWDLGARELPALLVARNADGIGKIGLEFAEGGALKAATSEPVPYDRNDSIYYADHAALKGRLVKYFLGSGDALLPDMRRLYPEQRGRDRYFSSEFFALAAAVIKEHEGAEIAFLKIMPLPGSLPGDVNSSMVETWLEPDEPLVRARIPGALITALRKSMEITASSSGDDDKYSRQVYYAEAGLDKSGKIGGLPLKDAEFYLAAFPESFLREQGKYPALKAIRGLETGRGTVKAVVTERLLSAREAAAPGAWEESVRSLVEKRAPAGPQWRFNLRNLSLQLSNTSVAGNRNFSKVSESKATAKDQTLLKGSARAYSEFYSGRYRLDNGVAADYYRSTVWPAGKAKVVTENVDQLLFENELRYSMFNYKGLLGAAVLGPFANAAYDTELTLNSGRPMRKVLRGKGGIKLFEGAILQELYAAGIVERKYTYSPARNKYGLETGFRLAMLIPGTAMTFNADGSYRNYSRSVYDTVSDLKRRLEINSRFSTKFYGDILISPFINYYAATGTVFSGTATNLMTGVSFEYSRLFKMKH